MIALIGEAKATAARRGTGGLQRLEHVRALLTDQGYDTTGTTLALFSLHDFYPDLVGSAAGRDDLLLVDLATLYGIGWPPVLSRCHRQPQRRDGACPRTASAEASGLPRPVQAVVATPMPMNSGPVVSFQRWRTVGWVRSARDGTDHAEAG